MTSTVTSAGSIFFHSFGQWEMYSTCHSISPPPQSSTPEESINSTDKKKGMHKSPGPCIHNRMYIHSFNHTHKHTHFLTVHFLNKREITTKIHIIRSKTDTKYYTAKDVEKSVSITDTKDRESRNSHRIANHRHHEEYSTLDTRGQENETTMPHTGSNGENTTIENTLWINTGSETALDKG